MNTLRFSTLSLILAVAVFALGYVNPAFAAPKKCAGAPAETPGCGSGDTGDVALYSVVITGALEGGSDDPWQGNFGGKNTIGLNDAAKDRTPGKFTDLSFFISVSAAEFGDAGNAAKCFLTATAGIIHQGSVSQGRKGTAKAGFFFQGFTHTVVANDEGVEALVPILYGLRLFDGSFDAVWFPDPDTTLTIMRWELSATNEGKAIKNISCIGEGTFGPAVQIKVTKEN